MRTFSTWADVFLNYKNVAVLPQSFDLDFEPRHFFFQLKFFPSGNLKKSRLCRSKTCIKLLREVKITEKIIEI